MQGKNICLVSSDNSPYWLYGSQFQKASHSGGPPSPPPTQFIIKLLSVFRRTKMYAKLYNIMDMNGGQA